MNQASSKEYLDFNEKRFDVVESSPTSWVSKAASDAYDYFFPKKEEKCVDVIGHLCDIIDEQKEHGGKAIDLSPELTTSADRVANNISDSGKVNGYYQDNEDAFKTALEAGKLEDFVRQVNLNLGMAGSSFRVFASEFTDHMAYAADGTKEGVPDVVEQDNKRALITITGLAFGTVSDRKEIAVDPKLDGYGKPYHKE